MLSAEGEKTSNIQLAKGQAEARLLVARAEAAAIAALRTALQQGGARARATDYLVALRYIQRLKEAGDYKKTNVCCSIFSTTIYSFLKTVLFVFHIAYIVTICFSRCSWCCFG